MNDSAPTRSFQPDTGDETAQFEAITPVPPPVPPDHIGRYRVERVLGVGGFGVVYLAHDNLLHRLVAVKVPHAGRLLTPRAAETYLAEARTVARLDHPNIVPVHDVGSTDEFPCYIVSKYIDGTNLAGLIQVDRPTLARAVEIVATVADAVHYAHEQGLVHRDLKPGNIVLDQAGKPFVADFGLAVWERDADREPDYAGTPLYMAPEQVRGEGHRVDVRSDVYSLGVMLYELMTGRRPFKAKTHAELILQITTMDARPPRSVNRAIPEQLERVCLKAMAKRAADRYATAKELADELRQALREPTGATQPTPSDGFADPTPSPSWAAVVPRGLRAFDAADAEFYLDLLPGPRDRRGLPEVVRFWKTRVEEPDPDQTFPVGLLYGPSGSGKSSLVKAGILPRLSPYIRTVYVEATPGCEPRLLRRLGRECPEAAGASDLPRALAAVRQAGLPGKVLLVLDQFEQWLHAWRGGSEGELVRALRQCDGGRLQCLVLIRDDFWMMSTRFMRELEVPVVEGHNAAAVDLFDPTHARKVLTAFGRAYGTLPHGELDPSAAAFLDRSIAELTHDGRVVPVRLALFADMVKGRAWTEATLRDLGGAVGVGVTFLDASFAAATAPPGYRQHQQAVRGVLGALLPAAGTDIKGSTRTRAELLAASGYEATPAPFEGLMRVLTGETRLLTPVAGDSGGEDEAAADGDRHYQLTHDYLVPSVRDWLTRKRMETRTGRAELRLAERAAMWQAKPEVRQLPSFAEWLAIRVLTRRRTWTEPEARMMAAASRRHLKAAVQVAAVVAILATAAVYARTKWVEEGRAARADGLVRHLLDANMGEVPGVVAELGEYRQWADPALERVLADPAAGRARHTRARLGLLPVDRRRAEELRDCFLEADPSDLPVLRDALTPHRADLVGPYWAVLTAERDNPDRRFRAAAALAAFDPVGPRWEGAAPWVAGHLVGQPSLVRSRWVDALRPVKGRLVPHLETLVRNPSHPDDAKVAAEILGDYAADRPDVLAEALADAAPDSFPYLFRPLATRPDRAVPELTAAFGRAAPDGQDANATASRRANLALALLRLGDGGRLWPLLKASPDPRARSFAIDRFAPLGCDPGALLDRLNMEPDDTIRAALWLGLGGFDARALPPDRRAALTPAVVRAVREDDSAAVHAAAWWVLGRWGARDATGPGVAVSRKGWSVTPAGHTMVRIAGPVEFMMGSRPKEGNQGNERYHAERIDHSFDIGMTEVTQAQFQRFLESRGEARAWAQSADAPVTRVTWYDAAAYCNWLSELDGLPPDQWCYEPNDEGKYADGMRIAPDFRKRRGYRLPTEAEWEFTCRGGAETRRCYGDADELLPRYAWYAANTTNEEYAPVARLLPNAFGLFDTHGNTTEWCQDAMHEYGNPDEAFSPVRDEKLRTLRGGHTFHLAKSIYSARRFADRPSYAESGGFRVAHSNP
jgi:serine/threonine protein kinase/formylglycine-generating enzyme required for sulfatase activity